MTFTSTTITNPIGSSLGKQTASECAANATILSTAVQAAENTMDQLDRLDAFVERLFGRGGDEVIHERPIPCGGLEGAVHRCLACSERLSKIVDELSERVG